MYVYKIVKIYTNMTLGLYLCDLCLLDTSSCAMQPVDVDWDCIFVFFFGFLPPNCFCCCGCDNSLEWLRYLCFAFVSSPCVCTEPSDLVCLPSVGIPKRCKLVTWPRP